MQGGDHGREGIGQSEALDLGIQRMLVGVPDLEVQMGSGGAALPRQRQRLSPLNGNLAGLEIQLRAVAAGAGTGLVDAGAQGVVEAREMGVDIGPARRGLQVDGPPVGPGGGAHADDAPVRDRAHHEAGLAAGLQIQAGVVSAGTVFHEAAGQEAGRQIQRPGKLGFGALDGGPQGGQEHDQMQDAGGRQAQLGAPSLDARTNLPLQTRDDKADDLQ